VRVAKNPAIVLAGFLVMFALAFRAKSQVQTSPCSTVQKALEDYGHLKVGMTRKEIEHRFEPDGGIQFNGSTRYLYVDCPYIKVEIKFKSSSPRSKPFAPDDISTEISKLFVEYPVAD
jgi:hypothetical protein